jgi:hypothetical protein
VKPSLRDVDFARSQFPEKADAMKTMRPATGSVPHLPGRFGAITALETALAFHAVAQPAMEAWSKL